MAVNKGLLTSNSAEWETPQDLYDALDAEFHFTLDPCSTDANAKCRKHYTKEQDGLKQDWTGETVFCNPPLWKRAGQVDQEVLQALHSGRYRRDADPGQDGYKGVSRLHLPQIRGALPEGAAALLRSRMECPIPVDDRYLQRCKLSEGETNNA